MCYFKIKFRHSIYGDKTKDYEIFPKIYMPLTSSIIKVGSSESLVDIVLPSDKHINQI